MCNDIKIWDISGIDEILVAIIFFSYNKAILTVTSMSSEGVKRQVCPWNKIIGYKRGAFHLGLVPKSFKWLNLCTLLLDISGVPHLP